MKVENLKEILTKDISLVIKVLESLGYHSFWQYKEDEWRGAVEGGENKTSIVIQTDNLYVKDFPNVISGDIIRFVEIVKGYTFKESMRYIQSITGVGVKEGSFKKRVNILSHFKRVSVEDKVNVEEVEVKSFTKAEKLSRFVRLPHYILVQECIMPKTQRKYDVSFDEQQSRILFPHHHYKNKELIVGISGRTTRSKEDMEDFDIPKYWNYINGYKKKFNLYGFSHAKEGIEKHKMIVIFEAEKSVLKHDTTQNGDVFSVALGSHELSSQQCQIILNNTSHDVEVVIAYDNDVKDMALKVDGNNVDYEGFIRNQLRSIMPFRKVSIIDDKYSLLGVKDSPIDKGMKRFNYLLKHRKGLN